MKKVLAIVLVAVMFACIQAPVLASNDTIAGNTQYKNLESGSRNVQWGWTELMERTHQEAVKGDGAGEQLFGVVAGSAIGVRKGIHRIGAGAIDLLTFWIPKKAPLIEPEGPPVQ
jgi:putative exosortase-associated protein (TIGR04073 family)